MKISNNGINFIKQFEGLCLKAYKCDANEKYYTIGYGHYSADVKPNATITREQALKLLQRDLEKFEKKVNDTLSLYNEKFTQNEFDALVSFCYNVGNIVTLTKNGMRTKLQIADAMLQYNRCGNKELKGLTIRRQKERELFLSDIVKNELYYKIYTGNSTQLDDILRDIGVPAKYVGNAKKRVPIAKANHINNYTGTREQNITLITLAKVGKLKRA